MSVQLRPYQGIAKAGVQSAWGTGYKFVLLVKPTGAGKTVTLGSIVHDHIGYACCIAHRQELVGQISKALAKEGIKHNVIAPKGVVSEIIQEHVREVGRSYVDRLAKVSVAGVDTLLRRDLGEYANQVTLWVIDEAHHVLENNKWGKAAALFPNAKGLGVTATPERADGMGLGKHHDGVFEIIIEGPTMRWLIDNGYLTDYRIFAPPSDIDLSQVTVGSTGDYNATKLRTAAHKSHIVGDVVEHYLRIAPGKRGVVFAVDVEISENIAEQFITRGVKAASVSAKTPEKERNRLIRHFKEGKIQVLVNVDLFGEGFDLPAIEVVSFARPTMSYGLFVQQFGRALRIMEGKEVAIIIDHVGNVTKHGLPDRTRTWSLDRRDKRTSSERDPDLIPTRTCISCLALYEALHGACPFCGEPFVPAGRSLPEQVDGNLIELSPEALAEMRGAIEQANRDPREWLDHSNHPNYIKASIVKKHDERQAAQQALKDTIAVWAGMRRDAGDSISQAMKRFYWKFGIDINTAQTLKRAETNELTMKITKDLLR